MPWQLRFSLGRTALLNQLMVLEDIPRETVLDKLGRELLIKLVDKIVVGQETVVDGVEWQETTISLVGADGLTKPQP